MKNYPTFFINSGKGYKMPTSFAKEDINDGFMFVLYYDNVNYEIMQRKDPYISDYFEPMEKLPIEKFDTKKEVTNFIERAKEIGFFNLKANNQLEIEYSDVQYIKYILPVYRLNDYGFAVYTFEEREVEAFSLKSIEIAKKKHEALHNALKIANFIDSIKKEFAKPTNTGFLFVKDQHCRHEFDFLCKEDYITVYGKDGYVIFDIKKVKENTTDLGMYVMETDSRNAHSFLVSNIHAIKNALNVKVYAKLL